MRKLIITFSLLLVAFFVKAAPIYGIRIEAHGNPIIVFIDKQQVSTSTTSCFVANLNSGNYRIEVYEAKYIAHGDRARRGALIYKELVHYSGRGIKDIVINNVRRHIYPADRNRDRNYRYDNVMDTRAFAHFFNSMKEAPFKSDRLNLLETALQTSYFTTKQCKMIVSTAHFDDDKVEMMQKLYPKVLDKQNFFMLLESLTFSSSKDKMTKFIKRYHDE